MSGDENETSIVEITPEMIKAGVLEFAQVDLHFETLEEAVTSIFTAMMQASAKYVKPFPASLQESSLHVF